MQEPSDTPASRTEATFEDLLALVRRLLGPQGCAWDRAQTPQSLLPYLIEEAYEVREAVLAGDDPGLRGELGDLALHVAFQSLLAEERGAFAPADVFRDILDKMARRHPHVFGTGAGAGSPPAAAAGDPAVEAPDGAPAEPLPWEEMKRRERAGPSGKARTLDGVPAALPALLRAQRIQERAAGVGFDWPDARGPLRKVKEELEEVERHVPGEHGGDGAGPGPAGRSPAGLREEVGDLLFAVVNLARLCGLSAEETLDLATAKFRRRFERVEDLAAERGLDVGSAGLERLDALWDEVKREG